MYDRLRRELSFAQGLMDGNQTLQQSSEGKVMQRLVKVVDELVEALQQMDNRQTELEEYVEAIDEDLNDLELSIYDDEESSSSVYMEVDCPECEEEAEAVEKED